MGCRQLSRYVGLMDNLTRLTHMYNGMIAGEESTCENKIDYKSEASAEKAAAKMNAKPTTRNELEAYPCYWCEGWHIGRVYKATY